jgi:mannose-6-phosphate isomerase-like protein (cupin superfamily)
MVKINLSPGRGTKLRENRSTLMNLSITAGESQSKMHLGQVMMILDNLLIPINHVGIASVEGIKVSVSPNKCYMVLNTSEIPIVIDTGDIDVSQHKIIYNPYLFEHESHVDYNSADFIEKYDIPAGYVDVLAKWYSIKFSYSDYNIILIRPGLGISLQSHTKREEYWEMITGDPIVISGSKVSYHNPQGTKFYIPLGNLHTVINPSEFSWVMFKENYKGIFDEEDIVRVFNPNHYN